MKFSFSITVIKYILEYTSFNILWKLPYFGLIFGKYVSNSNSKCDKYFEYSAKKQQMETPVLQIKCILAKLFRK